jgi:hypothetical protein
MIFTPWSKWRSYIDHLEDRFCKVARLVGAADEVSRDDWKKPNTALPRITGAGPLVFLPACEERKAPFENFEDSLEN